MCSCCHCNSDLFPSTKHLFMFIHSLIRSFAHPFIHLVIYSLIFFTHLLIHLPIHSLTQTFTHSSTYRMFVGAQGRTWAFHMRYTCSSTNPPPRPDFCCFQATQHLCKKHVLARKAHNSLFPLHPLLGQMLPRKQR